MHYDVIIIGTGAGGGTLAYRLAPSGKRILLLERGDYVPREKDNWSSRAVNVEAKYHTKEVWRDADGQAAASAHELLRRRQHQVLRRGALPPARARTSASSRHHGGVSPAWPIAYDDLEPYYTRGRAPLPGARRARRRSDRAAGERAVSASGRVSHEPRIQQLARRLRARSAAGRSTCRSASCSTRRTRARAAASAATPATASRAWSTPRPTRRCVCVDPALAHPNVTLLTDAYVDAARDERRRAARSRRSHVERDGADETLLAPTSSWSSCGAINSAALLLRSANDRHPHGLANGSDVVGRHYMGHVNSVLLAISKLPEPDRASRRRWRVNDFYFGDAECAVPDGPHLVRRQARRRWRSRRARRAIAPGLTLDLMAQALARLLADVRGPARSGQPRDARPRRRHRPRLHAEQRGGPQAADREARGPAEAAAQCPTTATTATQGSSRATSSSASASRSPASRTRTARSASATTRRRRRSTSNCKAHEVDNLYVVDGSFFPSSGAVNPALTIMANALRVGDHLLERLGATAAQRGGAHASA